MEPGSPIGPPGERGSERKVIDDGNENEAKTGKTKEKFARNSFQLHLVAAQKP